MKDFSPLGITNAAVGFPARLLRITRTDGTVIRVAESDTSVTVSGETFNVVAGFQISAVKHTSNGDMPSCEIHAVHKSGATIDSLELDRGLFDGATVQIYVIDRLNLSRMGLMFSGSVATISYSVDNQVVFQVKGPANSSKILMTQKRSPMCRTDLFSTLCQLNAASYVVTATVASIIDAFNFTVSGMSITPPADGYFNQGVGITSAGSKFRLSGWALSSMKVSAYLPCIRSIAVGQSITLYPGCDKTLGVTGCKKFSNQINFQGEPHFLGTAAAAQQV